MRGLKAVAALVLAAVGGSGQALADGAMAPAYGGQMVETPEGIRVEFAIREGAVRAWVRDHGDKPIPAAKVSGKATLLVGAKKLELPLQAEGEKLVADGAVSQADKVTAILSLGAAEDGRHRFGIGFAYPKPHSHRSPRRNSGAPNGRPVLRAGEGAWRGQQQAERCPRHLPQANRVITVPTQVKQCAEAHMARKDLHIQNEWNAFQRLALQREFLDALFTFGTKRPFPPAMSF